MENDLKNIRLATDADISRIQELIRSNPKTIVPRKEAEFKELLDTFWIYEHEGQLIGCVCLEVYSPKICEIRTLIVDERFRHMGIGKALMSVAIGEAKGRKIPQIMVITSDPAYFEKLNFGPDLNEKYALFFQGDNPVGAGTPTKKA